MEEEELDDIREAELIRYWLEGTPTPEREEREAKEREKQEEEKKKQEEEEQKWENQVTSMGEFAKKMVEADMETLKTQMKRKPTPATRVIAAEVSRRKKITYKYGNLDNNKEEQVEAKRKRHDITPNELELWEMLKKKASEEEERRRDVVTSEGGMSCPGAEPTTSTTRTTESTSIEASGTRPRPAK